jgi:UDP-N-acetyl-D-galactosamine dehydrogenase
MILAGRRINDGMGKYVAERTIKLLIAAGKPVRHCKVAILGLTFKENIPDLRNTRVIDIVRELTDYGIEVMVHDPFANPGEAREYYGLELQPLGKIADVHAVIVTVAHDPYRAMGLKKVVELCTDGAPVVLDIKGIFNAKEAEQLGAMYWRL